MTTRNYKIPYLLLPALLAACASHKGHVDRQTLAMTVKPIPRHPARSVPLPQTFGEYGRRSVAEVLRDFGPYAERQLMPYFERAGVGYPPREVTLVALKLEKKLELWARDAAEYRLVRTYDILAASGSAGPKLRQGDRQVPEGIYQIVGLNPNSNFHLSMKLNYPNAYDLYHAEEEGRRDPGSDIFIHGRAVSAGCLAMGDEAIEQLFVLTAQVSKENVKVVIAPHDPRVWPLEPTAAGQPEWTRELYAMITDEILAVSRPLRVSRNYRASPQTTSR
jgi:hypothetical protein